MTTDDIKQFARDCSGQDPVRIEWIDDTSANIVYSSAEMGLQALTALTQVPEEEDASSLPHLRLRSTKVPSTHPDSVLQVRSAVKSDRKQARAHEKSRFYLMHPEHDPRERLRQEFADRRRGDDTGEGDYRRRRFDDREHRRRRDRDEGDQFNANMYDDNAGSSNVEPERARDARRGRGQQELFPEDEGRSSGRLRNRSASPGRDTLEEELRGDRGGRDNGRRFRERSPRHGRQNKGRELFPSAGESESGTRELFPNKPTSSYIKKELLPSKSSHHRRSDAFDASVAGTSEHRRPSNIELFPDSTDNGARIRGVATEDQGFAIRGGSSNGMSIKGRGASVRELFPSKYDTGKDNVNAGKELFNDTLEGRGGRRRRAEDMFS